MKFASNRALGRPETLWAAAAVAYILAYGALPEGAQGWMLTFLNLSAGVVLLAAAAKMSESRGRIWRYLGAGLLVYGFGNVIWFTDNLILHTEASIVGTANVFYFAGYTICGIAVAVGIKRRDPAGFRRRLIDTAILFTGTGVFWWVWLIHPHLIDTSYEPWMRAIRVLYPLGDIVLIASFGTMIFMPGERRASNVTLISAIGAMIAADALYYNVSLENGYVIGSLPDLFWLLGFAGFGYAALIATREPDQVWIPTRDEGMSSRKVTTFITMSLVGPAALAASSLSTMSVSPVVVIVCLLILFMLVLARMGLLLKDQGQTIRELDLKTTEITAAEERHRRIINSLSEVIFQTDLKARWTFLNSAWEDLSGYTVDESLGRSCLSIVHTEDMDRLFSFFSTLLEGKRESFRKEIRGIHKDGSTRWIEIVLRLRRDPTGKIVGTTGTLTDITERKYAEDALVQAEQKYRTLVEQIPVVTYVDELGPSGRNIYISSRLKELLGYTPAEWRRDPDNWLSHLHPDDSGRVLMEHERSATDDIPFTCEYRVRHRDGHYVWVRDEAVLLRDVNGSPTFWQGVVIDITERKQLEEQLSHQAFHDPLTNLANRALFIDRVKHGLARRAVNDQHPIGVLFIDLDDFKTVNDSLGHSTGDRLLGAVAERLQGCLRASDTAARLGGDEFAVLLEETNDSSDARHVATRILEALSRPFRIEGHDINTGASIGIAFASSTATDVEALLRNADLAMYMAKREKGSFAIFEPQMHEAVLGRLRLKADLATAIGSGQLELRYQPIVDMKDRHVIGAEALLRWNHPRRGEVPPAEFIPLAEENDLINEIGRWVLVKACTEAATWTDSFGSTPIPHVTVNISGRQLVNPAFVTDVSESLFASGLAPNRLVLEITETALMTDIESGVRTLGELKELGVRIAVDDFGTGYSSLTYLKRFPLDILKIDRSFVEGVDHTEEGSALAQAVVRLGQTLGLTPIAEGVETEAQAERLLQLGCRSAQGYLYSPAVPADQLAEIAARIRSGARSSA